MGYFWLTLQSWGHFASVVNISNSSLIWLVLLCNVTQWERQRPWVSCWFSWKTPCCGVQLPTPPPAVEYPLDGSRIVTVSGKIRYVHDLFILFTLHCWAATVPSMFSQSDKCHSEQLTHKDWKSGWDVFLTSWKIAWKWRTGGLWTKLKLSHGALSWQGEMVLPSNEANYILLTAEWDSSHCTVQQSAQ